MFQRIEADITLRLSDVKQYVSFVEDSLPAPPNTPPSFLNLAKGVVDVHLYGMIEYTVNQTIAEVIDYLNNDSLRIIDIKPPILSLALDGRLSALIGVNAKRWDKRYELFNDIEMGISLNIANTLIPTDGKNLTQHQISSIEKIFCIQGSLFHDTAFKGVLQSIVGNRINVAHGNVSASQIGGALTISEIQKRADDTFSFCLNFIYTFKDYIANKNYKL